MKARALKFVSFERIQDHLAAGWMASIPNGPMHHHHYGIELKWICECPVPGGFKPRVKRVAISQSKETA